jgi:hypothetical protein
MHAAGDHQLRFYFTAQPFIKSDDIFILDIRDALVGDHNLSAGGGERSEYLCAENSHDYFTAKDLRCHNGRAGFLTGRDRSSFKGKLRVWPVSRPIN